MAGDQDEELLDVGADRSAHVDRWSQWWRAHRRAQLAVIAVMVGALIVVLVVQHRGSGGRRAAPTPSAGRATPTVSPDPARPRESDEYLIAVPAQDLRAELNRCGAACIARSLTGSALGEAAGAFAELRPLAGGTVTRRGRLVLQSIEGYAGGYAIAHLTVRAAGRAHSVGPSTATIARPGYLTTTVTAVRDGCRFTAVLVARASVPPAAAARRWAQRTPLRCG